MSNPGSLGNTTKVLDAVAGGIVGIAIGSIVGLVSQIVYMNSGKASDHKTVVGTTLFVAPIVLGTGICAYIAYK